MVMVVMAMVAAARMVVKFRCPRCHDLFEYDSMDDADRMIARREEHVRTCTRTCQHCFGNDSNFK